VINKDLLLAVDCRKVAGLHRPTLAIAKFLDSVEKRAWFGRFTTLNCWTIRFLFLKPPGLLTGGLQG
jgi:hypothetical protein